MPSAAEADASATRTPSAAVQSTTREPRARACRPTRSYRSSRGSSGSSSPKVRSEHLEPAEAVGRRAGRRLRAERVVVGDPRELEPDAQRDDAGPICATRERKQAEEGGPRAQQEEHAAASPSHRHAERAGRGRGTPAPIAVRATSRPSTNAVTRLADEDDARCPERDPAGDLEVARVHEAGDEEAPWASTRRRGRITASHGILVSRNDEQRRCEQRPAQRGAPSSRMRYTPAMTATPATAVRGRHRESAGSDRC